MANKRITKKKSNPTINKKRGSAKFIQLSSEFRAPITKPEKWLEYIKYGDSNNYPEFLIEMLAASGLHRAIIEKKVALTLGKGINIEDISPNTEEFISNVNPYETMDSLMEKCDYDLEVHGGYYIQMIWDPNTKTVKEMYHMDATRMRVGKPNEFGFVDDYFFFDDLDIPMANNLDVKNAIHYPAFSKTADMSEPQIYFVKKYSPTNKYYGSPIYESAILDIQTYAEISNFFNSLLKNSFAPSYLIFFTGTPPSPELEDGIVGALKDKYAGTDNVGKPMVFFLEDDMTDPIVKPIETSDLDKQFESLSTQIISNIAVSHQIPRQVVGLETTGSLGGSKEMLEATEIFKTSYIMPQQTTLLNSFNVIMDINGLDFIEIVNPSPNIMMYEIKDLLTILTKNELRDYLGYEEMDEEIKEEIDETIVEETIKKNEDIDE